MIHVSLDEIDGLAVYGYPRGAFWVQWRLFSRYASQVTIRGRSRQWAAKPIEEGGRACPDWFRELRFAFALLIRVLERAPGVGPVETLRFVNPPSGPCFLDEDLEPPAGDVVEGAVRRAVGNFMELGQLVVNEAWRRKFTCDCRGKVVFFLDLPQPREWLDPAVVEADVRALAEDYGVSVTTSVRLSERSPEADPPADAPRSLNLAGYVCVAVVVLAIAALLPVTDVVDDRIARLWNPGVLAAIAIGVHYAEPRPPLWQACCAGALLGLAYAGFVLGAQALSSSYLDLGPAEVVLQSLAIGVGPALAGGVLLRWLAPASHAGRAG